MLGGGERNAVPPSTSRALNVDQCNQMCHPRARTTAPGLRCTGHTIRNHACASYCVSMFRFPGGQLQKANTASRYSFLWRNTQLEASSGFSLQSEAGY